MICVGARAAAQSSGAVSSTRPPWLATPAPAGGRGYYRTPSLVSLWATAPYLHNNALGKYTGQVSVAARLDEFQDGITKLLWPEKREMTVKRTDRPTNLAPGLLHALPALLAHRLEGVLEEIVRDKLPRNLADAAVRDFKPAVDAAIGAVLKKLSRLDPADVQAELAALVDGFIEAQLADGHEILKNLYGGSEPPAKPPG